MSKSQNSTSTGAEMMEEKKMYAVHLCTYKSKGKKKLEKVLFNRLIAILSGKPFVDKFARLMKHNKWKKDAHSLVWNKGLRFLTLERVLSTEFEKEELEAKLNTFPTKFPKQV